MKRFLCVILLAGCPDDSTPSQPPDHEPTAPCVGFGLEFWTTTLTDRWYFGTSTSWRGDDTDPKPIAHGGVETVYVSGAPYDGDGMEVPFEAAVNSNALHIQAPTFTWYVPVTGAEPGIGDLCIYDQSSPDVHDGRRLVVRDVADMFVVPSISSSSTYESIPDPYPFTSWKMHVGVKRRIGVALVSSEGWRLVDDTMHVKVATDDAPFTDALRESWDSATVDVLHATTLRVRATLTSGETHDGHVEFVDHVERFAVRGTPDLMHLQIGYNTSACFDAFAGDARVIGADYAYKSSTTDVTLVSTTQTNCVAIHPVAYGSGTLTAQLDDKIIELPYAVIPTGS